MIKMYKIWLVLVLSLVQGRPHIRLEYKPTRPFHHPQPAGSHFGQIFPSGEPWPESQQSYHNFGEPAPDGIVDKIKETPDSFLWPAIPEDENASSGFEKPGKPTNVGIINLEYQPMRPPFHPNPGDSIGQIVPPSHPWPAKPEDYPDFSQTTNTPVIVDRLQDSSTEKATTSAIQEQTAIDIEYKPTRPFYHPNPGNTVSQVVPPGQPWPQDAGGYQNFTQTAQNGNKQTSTTPASSFIWEENLRNKENVASIGKQPNILLPIEDAKSVNTEPVTLVDRINDAGTLTSISKASREQPTISLEYKPNRPFYHPNPGNVIAQIVPPGQPWPAGPEGYPNFSQNGNPDIVNRIQETTSSSQSTTVTTIPNKGAPISLEYQPNRPFHASGGNLLSQSRPPGKPWPASAEGYQNFSQAAAPDLVNRIRESTSKQPELTTRKETVILEYQPNRPFHASGGNVLSQNRPPGKPWPANAEGYQNFSQAVAPDLVNRIQESTSKQPELTTTKETVILEYEPTRPSFHPNPGNNIAPIVPPGKPWPSSPEGYQNFSQIPSPRPNLEDRIKESVPSTTPQPPTAVSKEKPMSLEYQPNRPFHASGGNVLSQNRPAGEPWPANAEGYQNFSQTVAPDLVNRIQEVTSEKPRTTRETVALEYEPSRPSFHPNPGDTLNQIVPPGKPWPSSQEGYQNFGQVASSGPNLEDRIKGSIPSSTQSTPINPLDILSATVPPGQPWPGSLEGYQSFNQNPAVRPDLGLTPSSTQRTPINPADALSPIVPPGKPWPASLEGYQNFSQISPSPSSEDKEQVPTGEALRPGNPLPTGPEGNQTSSGNILLDRLAELVNKRKMQTTSETPQSGFTRETETSSEAPESVGPASTEKSSTESGSVETSTIDVATKAVQSATEGKLFTSPPMLTGFREETIILNPSGATGAVVEREGYRRPTVESAPFAVLPFNWSPSHYIFYI